MEPLQIENQQNSQDIQPLRLYRRRWWIMGMFGILQILNGAAMNVYVAAPQSSCEYYKEGNITMSDLNLSMSIGAAVFEVSVILMMILQARFYNMRAMTLISAWSLALSSIVRLIPTWIPSLMKKANGFIIAQAVLSMIGVAFSCSIPAQASATWFDAKNREFVLGILSQLDAGGIAIGFLVFPYIAQNGSHMADVLYILFISQIVVTLLITLYFPSKPPSPPSYSESYKREAKNDQIQQKDQNQSKILQQNSLHAVRDAKFKQKTKSSHEYNDSLYKPLSPEPPQSIQSYGLFTPTEQPSQIDQYQTPSYNSDIGDSVDNNIDEVQMTQVDQNQDEGQFNQQLEANQDNVPSTSHTDTILQSSSSSQISPQNSHASSIIHLHSSSHLDSLPTSLQSVKQQLKCIFRPQMLIFFITSGLHFGPVFAWNGNITFLLTQTGLSESISGIASFLAVVGNALGGIVVSYIAQKFIKRKEKKINLILFAASDLFMFIIMLLLPLPGKSSNGESNKILAKTPASILVILSTLAGSAGITAYPLFFVMAAELTFPEVSEAVTAGAVEFSSLLVKSLVLLVFSLVGVEFMTILTFVLLMASTIMIPFIRMEYRRSILEDKK